MAIFGKNQLNPELKFIVVRFGGFCGRLSRRSTNTDYGVGTLEKHLRDVDAFYLTVGEDRCETDIAAKYQKG